MAHASIVAPMSAEPLDRWTSFEEVLDQQSGVFRAADVREWISAAAIRNEVDAGRWQRAHRGVYVASNADLSTRQELWVCVLSGPPGSVLGGLPAAELDGLKNFTSSDIHLIIPVGSRKPSRPGMIAHYSSRLDERDVHPIRVPPRTRLARSLIDAAVWSRNERRSRAIILAGPQQRLVRPRDLRDALSRRGQCWHHATVTESIDDAEGGIASVPEHDFDVIVRTRGLPPPNRQVVLRRTDGRYYLDVDWTAYGVSAEVHGIQHMAIATWDNDLDRHSEIAADGRTLLQFSSYSVRHRKDHVANLVKRALRNRGWS